MRPAERMGMAMGCKEHPADITRPDGAICTNHDRYLAMDACLLASPGSIRCRFFAAAACVTHPRGGLGVLDGVLGRLVFTAEESAFLRHVHTILAQMNQRWFARLRLGVEIPGCEGLRGRALDHALVDLEQRRFTRAMHDYFKAAPGRQSRAMAGINAVLRRNPLLRSPLLAAPLRRALAVARTRRCIDLGDEAHRRAIGHALVDSIRESRNAPAHEND